MRTIKMKLSFIIMTGILDVLGPSFHSDFVENNKSVICQPRSVHIGKNCALGLEYGPWACGTVFPNTDLLDGK